MAPTPAARKDGWKVVFQNAWEVVKDVDRGGEGTSRDGTAGDESGKQMVGVQVQRLKGGRWTGTGRRILTEIPDANDAIFCLDDEMEAFGCAVREDDLDPQSDKQLLDLFGQLAGHRNTTPLVKDWVTILRDDHDRCVLISVVGSTMLTRRGAKEPDDSELLSTGTSSPTSNPAKPSRGAWTASERMGTAAERHRMVPETDLTDHAHVSDVPGAGRVAGKRRPRSRGGKATTFAEDPERHSIC